MRKNEALISAIKQLKAIGIKPKIWVGGRHLRLSWVLNGTKQTFTIAISPSDHRSVKNNRAQLRRLLRAA